MKIVFEFRGITYQYEGIVGWLIFIGIVIAVVVFWKLAFRFSDWIATKLTEYLFGRGV